MTQYEYKGKTYNSYNDLMMEKYRRMLYVSKKFKETDEKSKNPENFYQFIERFTRVINILHSRGIMVDGQDMTPNPIDHISKRRKEIFYAPIGNIK